MIFKAKPDQNVVEQSH